MKNMTRMILQLDFTIAGKAAKTVAKRATRLQGLAKKRGAKLRLLIPGLILHTSVLRSLDIKTGPTDKKTGEPKYRIFRGKMRDNEPVVVKPAKPVKGAKPAKAVRKAPRKARRSRKAAPETAPVTPPAPPAATAPAMTPSLATELADSSAPASPSTATHARRSRQTAPVPATTPAPTGTQP